MRLGRSVLIKKTKEERGKHFTRGYGDPECYATGGVRLDAHFRVFIAMKIVSNASTESTPEGERRIRPSRMSRKVAGHSSRKKCATPVGLIFVTFDAGNNPRSLPRGNARGVSAANTLTRRPTKLSRRGEKPRSRCLFRERRMH